jgi:hypothetical protein
MQYKLVVNISKKELKVIRKCLLVYIEDKLNILIQSKELIFTIELMHAYAGEIDPWSARKTKVTVVGCLC